MIKPNNFNTELRGWKAFSLETNIFIPMAKLLRELTKYLFIYILNLLNSYACLVVEVISSYHSALDKAHMKTRISNTDIQVKIAVSFLHGHLIQKKKKNS